MFTLKTLRAQLTAVIAGCLLLLGGVALLSIATLRDVNDASVSVRDHWLQSLRTLGDLNNFTSDYRAAEASLLIAASAGVVGDLDAERKDLLRQVNVAMREYEGLEHSDFELVLYARFKTQWRLYLEEAGAVAQRAADRKIAGAQDRFLGESRQVYDAASDTLGELTLRSVAAAAAASDHAARAYATAQRYMGAALALAIVAVALLMLYIHRSIARPLTTLAGTLRALAEGRTDISIGAGWRGEIGEMAQAVAIFRNYVIELGQIQQGLRQQAVQLEERLLQEQRLTAMQRNFVSMVSHEFRTPLTIIDGHAQRFVKLRDTLQPDVIETRARKIRAAVLRMTQVMESLLTSTRLANGEEVLHFSAQRVDATRLLHEACQLQREITRGAIIVENFRQMPATIVGDLHLLQQALGNLLSNALKYSSPGSEVRVEAHGDAEHLVVKVTDRGIGISAQDLPELFQCYRRGSNVGGIVGTGIGLYLVRMVAELHHGRVEAESAPGQGATFTLTLPLGPAEDQGEAEAASVDDARARSGAPS